MPLTAHDSNSTEYSAWPQGRRLEPTILSGILVDEGPEQSQERLVNHHFSLTLLLSISAHLLIFAVAAWSASKTTRFAVVTENPRPGSSVQIRILESMPRNLRETMSLPEVPVDAGVVLSPASQQPVGGQPAIEMPAVSGDTSPQSDTATAAEQSASTPVAIEPLPYLQRIAPPTSHELRAAIQRRAAVDRQRSADILCEHTQQRQLMMDCGVTEATHDMALAEQNDAVEYFSRTTLPKGLDTRDAISAGGRVKANIDIMDAQLGTTQTRKRIMGIP